MFTVIKYLLKGAMLGALIGIMALAITLWCETKADGSGLYNKAKNPISGETVTYRRAPRIEITNERDRSPQMEFTTYEVKVFPDGDSKEKFVRRVKMNGAEYLGKQIPLLHPETGQQIGWTSPENAYVLMYSLFVFAEKEQDLRDSPPAVIAPVTNGQEVVLP
jgi:hypothetical protein